jgi:hypothetical protein
LSEDEVDVSSESDILEDLMNQPTEDGQMHASKVPYNADINNYISGNLFFKFFSQIQSPYMLDAVLSHDLAYYTIFCI